VCAACRPAPRARWRFPRDVVRSAWSWIRVGDAARRWPAPAWSAGAPALGFEVTACAGFLWLVVRLSG
jgi:hypothetical protein